MLFRSVKRHGGYTMGETLKIDYLNRDSLNATIWVDGKNVKLKSYTSDIIRSV